MTDICYQNKNICVNLLGPLGDVVNSSSLFRRLKECYPNSNISIITIQRGVEASYGIKEIDNRYIYKKEKGLKGFINMILFAKNLGRQDIYIVLDNSFRSALLAFLNGAKCRIGRKGQSREIFLTHILPYTKEEYTEQIPVYEHYYRCLKPLNIYDNNNKTSFYFSDNDEKTANEILKTNCQTNKPKIGLCLFAGDYEKSLEIDNAVEIVSKLLKKFPNYEYISIGGKDVQDRWNKVCQKFTNKVINLAGLTSYAQSACIIAKCAKFISVDTSPLHLAIAEKTPVLAIFFSHIYKKWGPEDLEYNKLILNRESKKINVDEVLEKLMQMQDKRK